MSLSIENRIVLKGLTTIVISKQTANVGDSFSVRSDNGCT